MADEHNDEIDLTELMVKMRNVLVRNTILIVILILSGLSLGLAYYLLKPPVYQSEIVLRAGVLDGPMLNTLNGSLTRLIDEGNFDALSSKLKISSEVAKNVKKIVISAVGEEGEFYRISASSLSPENWQDLQQGLLDYLRNNAYVNRRVALQEQRYKNLIAKLDAEIQQLDSLNLMSNGGEKVGKGNFIIMNPSDVYSTLITLYKERQEYKEELEYNTAVEVFEEFEAYEQPVSPKLLFSMGIGALIGLVLAIFLVFAIEMDNYLKKSEIN